MPFEQSISNIIHYVPRVLKIKNSYSSENIHIDNLTFLSFK